MDATFPFYNDVVIDKSAEPKRPRSAAEKMRDMESRHAALDDLILHHCVCNCVCVVASCFAVLRG